MQIVIGKGQIIFSFVDQESVDQALVRFPVLVDADNPAFLNTVKTQILDGFSHRVFVRKKALCRRLRNEHVSLLREILPPPRQQGDVEHIQDGSFRIRVVNALDFFKLSLRAFQPDVTEIRVSFFIIITNQGYVRRTVRDHLNDRPVAYFPIQAVMERRHLDDIDIFAAREPVVAIVPPHLAQQDQEDGESDAQPNEIHQCREPTVFEFEFGH